MQRSENSNEPKTLSVLTYNVWRNNTADNRIRLAKYIADSDADVVCLQEFTRGFYYTLSSLPEIVDKYDCSMTEAFVNSQKKFFEDDVILVKKELKASLNGHLALAKSKDKRYFTYGSLVINGVNIAIGTAHLESKFFKPEFTAIKTAQLNQICETITNIKPDCFIFAGDCNFTGGDQLAKENEAILNCKLVDIYASQHPEMIESEEDEDYQTNHVTWDGTRNPNVQYAEHHRPDRVFMRFFKPVPVIEVDIKRIESDMSDHYGLRATFNVGK